MSQSFFEQFLIILCCAVIATTLFRRIGLPPLLAYLGVGALLGPYSIGLVEDIDRIALLSELGVVFLLFMLGLEFSASRMIAMRRTVFGLGSLQVIITACSLIGIGLLFELPLNTTLVLAGALSLSSTAIVSRELIRRDELDSTHGQLSVGILIFQDLAAVFFLILVPTLGSGVNTPIDSTGIVLLLLEGATLLIVLLLVGHILMPILFHESARSGSSDVFVLTSLAATLLAAWLTHTAGLSMALGGFIAGMMLGESHYRYQLEADIRPFRDVLLGLFFVSVGMQLDLNALLQNWYWVLIFTLGLILLKTLIITLLGTLSHKDPASALRAGLSLSQGGEFGFALLALALSSGLVTPEINAIIVSTIISSMIITPILMNHTEHLSRLLHSQPKGVSPSLQPFNSAEGKALSGHVIICGFGRVGQVIARFLDQAGIEYIVVDSDPLRVSEAATAGEHICFGDARRDDLLETLGAAEARMLVLSFPDPSISLSALQNIRRRCPDLPVMVRTRDDRQLEELQQAGATTVIPETLEASLMMCSQVLTLLQVDPEKIQQQLNLVRAEHYQLLHGYYHGQGSDKFDSSGNMNEILHPVTLGQHSYAQGKSLQSLKLNGYQVRVVMVRRDDRSEQNPGPKTLFKTGDILVLQGPADQVEAAETLLQEGP